MEIGYLGWRDDGTVDCHYQASSRTKGSVAWREEDKWLEVHN
jgi:hypothetical protein